MVGQDAKRFAGVDLLAALDRQALDVEEMVVAAVELFVVLRRLDGERLQQEPR